MKKELFLKILAFEQWRLERYKKKLESKLEETNQQLSQIYEVNANK